MPNAIAEASPKSLNSEAPLDANPIKVYSDVGNQAGHNAGPAPIETDQPSDPIQLSPEELQKFISQGFLKLDAGLPQSFHDYMVAQLSESVMGNNVVPSCPDLENVYRSPRIAGAIESVLGKEYALHSHRHLHMSPSGSDIGGWHKDSQWGYGKRQRNNRPRWVMLLYFPNDLPEEIGGTGVIPGLQYTHQKVSAEEEVSLGRGTIGDAGTCVMMHYDTWHAKFKNRSEIDRIMVKLQFFALSQPEPRNDLPVPQWEAVGPISQQGMWNDIWSWYGGKTASPMESHELIPQALEHLEASSWQERNFGADQLGQIANLNEESFIALKRALDDESEVVATNAAISLANQGKDGLDILKKAFLAEDIKHVQSVIQGLIVAGSASENILLEALSHDSPQTRFLACYALGELAMDSQPHLDILCQRLLNDTDMKVRVNAAYALGIHPQGHRVLQNLFDCLAEENDELRMFSMYSIVRHAEHAQRWEDLVARTLNDGNRYLKALAVEALHRLNTPTSLQTLISYLKTHRWCEQNGTRGGF
jgi:hypothetical protein